MLLNLYLGHSDEPIDYSSPVSVECWYYTKAEVVGRTMCVFVTEYGDLKCEPKSDIREIRLNGNHRLTAAEAATLQRICEDFDTILVE